MAVSICDYFSKNGISPKSSSDETAEHRRVASIPDEDEFFNEYFKIGLDDFMACLDYSLNVRMFPHLLSEVLNFSDFFEPCCQSGLLGCFVALNAQGKFKGMDINPLAVERAGIRAVKNGLAQSIFELGDILEYQCQHEAVIGRYVLNTPLLGIDEEALDAVARISKNLVLVQHSQSFSVALTIEMYKSALKRHGYTTEIISSPAESQATGAYEFILKAVK